MWARVAKFGRNLFIIWGYKNTNRRTDDMYFKHIKLKIYHAQFRWIRHNGF